MPNVTTSIPLDLWNLAKEKNLPWNECLIAGIRALLDQNHHFQGEKIIKESAQSKLEKVQRTMQSTIDDLNDKLIKGIKQKKFKSF